MRKANKIIIFIMIIAMLLLGIGYSAISNITLNITGTISSVAPVVTPSITNANIGDYVDLGNNIVNNSATTDDWRILYVESSRIYVILADYLPNSTSYAKNAGLETNGSYSVYSTSGTNLYNKLTTQSYWKNLSNGITGATVTGSPTASMIINSYNYKNSTSLNYTNKPKLSSSTSTYSLYVPRTSAANECQGYWFTTYYESDKSCLWRVNYNGEIDYNYYHRTYRGIRPVVSIPKTATITKSGSVWKIR